MSKAGGSAANADASLGTLTKSVNPLHSSSHIPLPQVAPYYDDNLGRVGKSANRLERWALQSASREILKGERVGICLRRPRSKVSSVNVYKSTLRDSFHYGNLMVCGSVWTCPVCASKITEKRRHELSGAFTKWQDQGGGVLLLTLTVPHYSHQSLRRVLDGISKARGLMLNRKPWKRLKTTLGIVGEIRATEVTHGANGWHPHFHVLIFTRAPFTKESLPVMETLILDQWQKACKSSLLPAPNKHGVSLEDGSKAASYASKWGLEHEMTKGHVKQGREGGRTPFDLLRLYLAEKSKEAALLFSEYAKAFKGKRQLVWSEGLREMLQLDREATDEELATAQDDDAHLFAEIPLNVWRLILQRDLRGHLLEVCRQGYEALLDWMIDLCEDAGMIGDS